MQSLAEWALQNYFVLSYITIGTRNCTVNTRSVDWDSWEVSFSSMVNLFYTWIELNHTTCSWITQHAALASSYCKLENHVVFYFNLLLIVYLVYSIKVTVFRRSLACFYLVINFINCRMSATALVRLPNDRMLSNSIRNTRSGIKAWFI